MPTDALPDEELPRVPKPERYAIYYLDSAREAEICRRTGCLPEDVDPALLEEFKDANTLAGARSVQRGIERRGEGYDCYIEERVNIRVERNALGILEWRWEQEPVGDGG